MGSKPRKEPLLIKDLASASAHINIGGVIWEVIRRVMPENPHQHFGMVLPNANYQRLTRGVNAGGHRMTLVVEYKNFDENGNPIDGE